MEIEDDEEIFCTCEGVREIIKSGIKSLKKQKAPNFVIEDFILDMTHGLWKNCKCKASQAAEK